tara:strand:- start:4431 stop:5261 length:831 start_codon:yes stop_codon:yes gene_type:complete
MTNFSSFFPAAGGGGGGFTKMNKYSTNRALNDATHKTPSPALIDGQLLAAPSSGQTSFSWRLDATAQDQIDRTSTVNGLVDYTFTHSSTVHTITANTGAGYYTAQTVTFTPALTAGITYAGHIDFSAPTFITVNPATDLGLEDGASLGYFLVGGGGSNSGNSDGGRGGYIIQGTAIITNASTDLVLTPGVATAASGNGIGSASTISGGLTITTSDGNPNNGFGARGNGDANVGILGYGLGGRSYSYAGGGAIGGHGFGNGSPRISVPGDGAILLFY